MALNFFTQRDIENFDVNDVPEEFINYFEGLTYERKEAILASRPDLSAVLLHGQLEISDTSDVVIDSEDRDDTAENDENVISTEDKVESADEQTDSLAEDAYIPNYYDGCDLTKLAEDKLIPFEALVIRDEQEKCIVHKRKFKKLSVTYHIGKRTCRLEPDYCVECNRLFIPFSKEETYKSYLKNWGIQDQIYNFEDSSRYIRSQLSEIEFAADDQIYVPDVWIEENPQCPIHEEMLDEFPYVIKSGEREVRFKGYICNKCNKTIIRKSKALDLEDECARKGVRMPKISPLVEKKPKKEKVTAKKLKPHYFVENGHKEEFKYEDSDAFYRLTEEDTIVVSDSIYCNYLEHNTEEVEIIFWVNTKKEGRKLFLCLAGYCAQCQKYYLSEEDYKVIYGLGRPEVTVITDLEENDYQITSGEVFDLERGHLENLEADFAKQINEIQNAKDYVNPFSTIGGGYDDGGLSYSKDLSKRKYGPILEQIERHQPKPYTYRVDIVFDGKTEVYYVGADDIKVNGDTRVISYNSDFGKTLVNYRSINITKDGKKYDIKLSRQFDIEHEQLYGYVNLRTDEDMIFRAGITDPFLIKVLNLRKKQHNLVDIIATIQENQNAIVDFPFTKNLIVQGCAGSGKTMVLLHRLSSLKYKYQGFDFANALILTPNEQFNLHIKGLAEGLQIGGIDRISVEQYYIDILKEYSGEFVPKNKVASEVFVNQAFVDYTYSDEFLDKFNLAYADVMEARADLLVMVKGLTEAFGESYEEISKDIESEFIPKIRRRVERFVGLISTKDNQIAEAVKQLDSVQNRNVELQAKIPEAEEFSNNVVKEALPRVNTKIWTYVSGLQNEIKAQQETIGQLGEEREKASNQFLPFGKRMKLDKFDAEITQETKKLDSMQRNLDAQKEIFDFDTTDKDDEAIIDWMKQVKLYIGDVQDEIRLCERGKNDLPQYLEEAKEINEKIRLAEERLAEEEQGRYSDEVRQSIQYLQAKIEEYGDFSTFQQVFDAAVAEFKTVNKTKVNKGIHRYDLYARLLFCMKYYNKQIGHYNFICVDEGQDMSLNEYRLIYELNHRNVVFNIYGDTNQLLKPGRGIASWDDLAKKYNMTKQQLNENYRNTNQITRFCNVSFGMDIMQTGVDGAKVREIPRRELEKELSELSIGNERVAILIPRSVHRSQYLVKEVIPENIRKLIGDKIGNGLIAIMYVDEVKGIEFDKVFVVVNKMTKNEKYIAYTRALSELIVVVDEEIVEQEPVDEMVEYSELPSALDGINMM